MTEVAPHMDFDIQECIQRLGCRSSKDKFFEAVAGASMAYAEETEAEAKQWENAYHAEKAKNEYLMKLLEQSGIPVPDFSMGIPPSVPIKAKKKTKTKEKHFKELLQVDDTKNILKRLHKRIDGHGGKDVALVLLRAFKDKIISGFPSETVFKTEFKDITSEWRSISHYLNPNCSPTPDCSAIVI